jgi:surface protein
MHGRLIDRYFIRSRRIFCNVRATSTPVVISGPLSRLSNELFYHNMPPNFTLFPMCFLLSRVIHFDWRPPTPHFSVRRSASCRSALRLYLGKKRTGMRSGYFERILAALPCAYLFNRTAKCWSELIRNALLGILSVNILASHFCGQQNATIFNKNFVPFVPTPSGSTTGRTSAERNLTVFFSFVVPLKVAGNWIRSLILQPTLGMEWSVDILAQLLGWLAWDGASVAVQHLAYLTINSTELREAARMMQNPMVLDVHVDHTLENQFMIPITDSHLVNIKINWGDGKEEIFSNSHPVAVVQHTYSHAGDYVVRVFPADNIGPVWLDHIGFLFAKLRFELWWRPLRAFRSLGTLGIRSLSGLFQKAEKFNLPLSHLDMRNVIDLSCMFFDAASFNQPINSWNVSNVTNMSKMFFGASSFNQPLDGWDVGKVENMSLMFFEAKSFNQPIGNWNISRVKYMNEMFCCASVFNQDLSSWDVSNVWFIDLIFKAAYQFNLQSIRGWKYHPEINPNLHIL